MDRHQERQLAKEDAKLLRRGIDPMHQGPDYLMALGREAGRATRRAVTLGNLTPIIELITRCADNTLARLWDIPVACKKGCAHCCHIWVSITPPEALHIARIVRARGLQAVEKIMVAHAATRQHSHEARPSHPYPCPLLADARCTIYSHRPLACRLAASGDAEVCARSYMNETDEGIPTPLMYMVANQTIHVALIAALRESGLAHSPIEMNGALAVALSRDDSEAAWLAGEDVFREVGKAPEPAEIRDLQRLIFS